MVNELMKKFLFYISAPLLALTMFSCSESESLDDELFDTQKIVVTGSLSQGSSARTAHSEGESSISVTWEAGDVIGLMSASQTTPLAYTAMTSGATSEFQSESEEEIAGTEGETFYAWYPYQGGSDETYANALTPKLYRQYYNDGEFPSEMDFIYSQGNIEDNELNLCFSHLYAFLKITISPDMLNERGFTLCSTQTIAYQDDSAMTSIDLSDGTLSNTNASSNWIWYWFDEEDLESEEDLVCYVAMLPTTENSMMYICQLTSTATGYSTTTSNSIYSKSAPSGGFQAGHVYTVSINDEEEEIYESTDYSADGEVYTLQTHTEGDGIKIVILGEAYSDRLIEDGTYKKHVDWAYEALFSEEPFTTFKNYFDVYYVTTVSANEYIGGDTKFGTSITNSQVDTSNYSDVYDYLDGLNIYGSDELDKNVVVLMNASTSFRSVTSMAYGYKSSGGEKIYYGQSIAYCACLYETDAKEVIQHEACGHGFGQLADEYVEYEGYTLPTSWASALQSYWTYNLYQNVDATNDTNEVLWADFLSDERYEGENLGCYEGAWLYSYGAYRSTENSIMRYNTGGFNAPSRLAIYKRIINLSGGTYSFDDFLEYDEVNRNAYTSGSAKSRNATTRHAVLGAPPVVIELK